MDNFIIVKNKYLINVDKIVAVEQVDKDAIITLDIGYVEVKNIDIKTIYELIRLVRQLDKPISVTETIEEVKVEMCNDFCRYPREWDEEKEGMELVESNHCQNCPLNRL